MRNILTSPKRKIAVVVGIVAVLGIVASISAYAANQSTPDKSAQIIGEAEASDIALNDAGYEASKVSNMEIELDTDNGVKEYSVEFTAEGIEYDYEINAEDGSIRDKDSEVVDEDYYDEDSEDSDEDVSDNSSDSTDSSADSSNSSDISANDAKTIALEDASMEESNVTFSKVKKEYDDGMYIYDVEFYADGIEYDYEINASNGNIIEYDVDR